jgi:hypothetical protein
MARTVNTAPATAADVRAHYLRSPKSRAALSPEALHTVYREDGTALKGLIHPEALVQFTKATGRTYVKGTKAPRVAAKVTATVRREGQRPLTRSVPLDEARVLVRSRGLDVGARGRFPKVAQTLLSDILTEQHAAEQGGAAQV